MNDEQLYDELQRGAPVAHCRARLEHQRLAMISKRARRDRLAPRWAA